MKVKFHSTTIVLLIYTIYSCSKPTNDRADFTENSFKETYQLQKGISYRNDSLFIGRPRWIRFHPDSFLILQDMGTPKLVKIIDLKNNKIQEVIPQGKGPGEMVVAWGIQILDKNLYVFDGQQRKVIILKPDSNRRFFITDEFSSDEKGTMGFYPIKQSMLVCLSSLGDDKRLTFLDGKGKIIKKMGDYPPLLSSNDIKADNDIFQSYISASPDGNRIVLACTNTDLLEIYDAKKGLIKRFQGPLAIKLYATRRDIGIGTMIHCEPWYATYNSVDANENEFWVGYCGYKAEKDIRPSESDLYLRQIFCFDWDGTPLKRIKFIHPFFAFDVDWKGKVLYTLAFNDDTEIVAYSLNGILK